MPARFKASWIAKRALCDIAGRSSGLHRGRATRSSDDAPKPANATLGAGS